MAQGALLDEDMNVVNIIEYDPKVPYDLPDNLVLVPLITDEVVSPGSKISPFGEFIKPDIKEVKVVETDEEEDLRVSNLEAVVDQLVIDHLMGGTP